MLDDAAPRGWSFHESFTTAYHEPASRHIPLHEDTFAVRTSSRPPRPPPASARLDRNLLPPLRPQPSSTPPQATWAATRRRPMYDPVRDSASSRPPDSPTHTRPAARSPRLHHYPEDEDRKPLPACQTCGEAHAGDCTSESHWRQYHDDDGDDEPGRAQIHRRLSRHSSRDYLAAGTSFSGVSYGVEPARTSAIRSSFSIDERGPPHLPPILPPEHHTRQTVDDVGSIGITPVVPLTPQLYQSRANYPPGRHTWEHDRRSSTKRARAEADDTTDRRSPSYSSPAHPLPYLDIKGKRKMMSSSQSQSPAFRLDTLLESSPVELARPAAHSSPAIGGYERPSYDPPPSETRAPSMPVPSMPVFGGFLPPPPFLGSSAVGPTHTGIASLGISVGKVDLGQFADADDFEKDIIAGSSSSLSNAHASSSRLPEIPGSKPARKLAPSAPRRKSRGLFPHDDVPLVISSSTTKQSRYRPSGDRQPVACGYKDPITQVQCDEPFNRPVELRRHVRAVHVPAEALAVTMGQLSRSQAKLLPNDWKPGDGDVLRPTCVCGKVFSRLDALRRHWTGVNAKVVDGKCIECPSSLAKKKDHQVPEQGNDSIYGAPVYS